MWYQKYVDIHSYRSVFTQIASTLLLFEASQPMTTWSVVLTPIHLAHKHMSRVNTKQSTTDQTLRGSLPSRVSTSSFYPKRQTVKDTAQSCTAQKTITKWRLPVCSSTGHHFTPFEEESRRSERPEQPSKRTRSELHVRRCGVRDVTGCSRDGIISGFRTQLF